MQASERDDLRSTVCGPNRLVYAALCWTLVSSASSFRRSHSAELELELERLFSKLASGERAPRQDGRQVAALAWPINAHAQGKRAPAGQLWPARCSLGCRPESSQTDTQTDRQSATG